MTAIEIQPSEQAFCRVHTFRDSSGTFEVWLDTEIAERDGLCIGIGATLQEAVQSAVRELEMALSYIQEGGMAGHG